MGQFYVLGEEAYLLKGMHDALLFDYGVAFRPWPANTHPIIKRIYKREAYGPDPKLIPNGIKITAAIASHGHFDHVGAFPALETENLFEKEAKIHATPQTQRVMEIDYEESLKHSPHLYTIFDVLKSVERLRNLPAGEFQVSPEFTIYSVHAGHLPGAASCIVRTTGGKKYLLLGDTCFHDQPIVKGARKLSETVPPEWLPDSILAFDPFTLLGEKYSWEDQITKLRAQIEEHPKSRFLIAALAVGRGQAVALRLRDCGLPVWVDGGVRKIFKIFRDYRWLPEYDLDFSTEGINFIQSSAEREALAKDDAPSVIVTSAGMEDVGAIAAYLPYILPNRDNFFITTSYLPPESKNAEIMIKKAKLENPRVRIAGEQIEINCRTEEFKLTAHGNFPDTKEFLRDLVRARGRKLERFVFRRPRGIEKIAPIRFLRDEITDELIVSSHGTAITI